jgi:tetratricopeptide (TPR) repeat protein
MKLSSLVLGLAVMVMGCAAKQAPTTTSASPPGTATYAPVASASSAEGHELSKLDQAVRLYQQHEYEQAALAFEEAYALEQEPSLLLAQAQALRLAGDCEQAKPLYEAFLREAPSPTYASWVHQVASDCTPR